MSRAPQQMNVAAPAILFIGLLVFPVLTLYGAGARDRAFLIVTNIVCLIGVVGALATNQELLLLVYACGLGPLLVRSFTARPLDSGGLGSAHNPQLSATSVRWIAGMLTVLLVVFACLAANRYHLQQDGNRMLIFDRWTGTVSTRY